MIIVICYGKEIFKVKDKNGNVNFRTQFCLRGISNKISAIDYREASLKRNVHDLSVDYNSIDKSDNFYTNNFL